MNTYWKIETHGDPIGTIQGFIQHIWDRARLDGMLIAVDCESQAQLIEDPAAMDKVNPFRPLMRENLARRLPKLIQERPQRRIGALLRPCEIRALLEIDRRQPLPKDQLFLICVDCLGTYPLEEYEWRASKKGSQEQVASEALKFARQGGILAYRYRASCQTCSSPGAQSAELNIHVLGLPVREQLLVEARNSGSTDYLDLASLASGHADQAIIQQHQHVVSRQTDFHRLTFERLLQALNEFLPKDLDQLIAQLENCQNCQRCMTVCPICSAEFPLKDAEGHYSRWAIERWLVSCAGCGMCEQACKDNLPLGVIFGSIREKLREEFNYIPRDYMV
jgi:formate dehydrogenase (coenzyme F420) beta subunit